MPRGKDKKVKSRKVKSKKDKELEIEKELEREIEDERKSKTQPKKQNIPIRQEDDRDKRLIMWAGVIFFMSIILILWILNINSVFRNMSGKNNNQGLNLDKITESYNKALDDLSQNLSRINSIKENVNAPATSTGSVAGTDNSSLDKEDISALKQKIEELEKKLNNPIATSTGHLVE